MERVVQSDRQSVPGPPEGGVTFRLGYRTISQDRGRKRPDGGRDSGFGLDLSVEGLSLSFQAPELPLDEVGQSLPHFQLKAALQHKTMNLNPAMTFSARHSSGSLLGQVISDTVITACSHLALVFSSQRFHELLHTERLPHQDRDALGQNHSLRRAQSCDTTLRGCWFLCERSYLPNSRNVWLHVGQDVTQTSRRSHRGQFSDQPL